VNQTGDGFVIEVVVWKTLVIAYSLKRIFTPKNHYGIDCTINIAFRYVYSFISLPFSVNIYFDLCRTMRMHNISHVDGEKVNDMMHA
jgi:hypothetical protein